MTRLLIYLRSCLTIYPLFRLCLFALPALALLYATTLYATIEIVRFGFPSVARSGTIYSAAYWFSHPVQAVAISLVLLVLYLGEPLEPFHQWLFGRHRLIRLRSSKDRRQVRRYTRVSKFLIAASLFYLWPLTTRQYPAMAVVLAAAAPLPFVVLGYIGLLGFHWPSRDRIKPLATLRFTSRPFTVAEMSSEPEEALDEIRRYEALARSKGKTAPPTQRYIDSGEGAVGFRGLPATFQTLASALGPQVQPTDIEFFDRTVAALMHALSELIDSSRQQNRKIHLFYTDLEYDQLKTHCKTLMASSDEVSAIEVPIAELVLDNKPEAEVLSMVRATLLEAAKRQAAPAGRASGKTASEEGTTDKTRVPSTPPSHVRILLVSHVHFATGAVLPVEEFRQCLDDTRASSNGAAARDFIVCDGAQSLGHVPAAATLLNAVDYFATCTHKWVLGRESLGILYRNKQRLGDAEVAKATSGRGLSTTQYKTSTDSGTIDLRPLISASVCLGEQMAIGYDKINSHNTKLANIFKELVHRNYLGSCVQPLRHGGIVLLTPGDALGADKVNSALPPAFQGTLRERKPGNVSIRFCFHYFHSESDVIELTLRIDAAMAQCRPPLDS